MIYNKCLNSTGYDDLPEAGEVLEYIKGKSFRYEHEHRKWEYGLALKLIKEFSPKTMLNVGGGKSPLSSMAAGLGTKVTEVDPTEGGYDFPLISYIYDSFPSNLIDDRYDMIVCTSVIEHVENDVDFFDALVERTGKALFLTADFHPSGGQLSFAHLRTYNMEKIMSLINRARVSGLVPYGSIHYFYEHPMVYGYTFAALALWKPDHV